jgi:hypothetical protein
MAKICSVPSKSGNIVENLIHFDMLRAIYEDALIYNHLLDYINGGKGMYGLFSKDSSSNISMNSYKSPMIVNKAKFTKRFSNTQN